MQAFWFGVIAVLWAGFFVLEGFDFGVGLLLPLVTRSEDERRQVLRTIGPVWDGNEVWLLVAGGATFAAFPEWYASMFSGFYLAFALLLVGLILRGIGLEYRGKADTARGRAWCDAATVVGSLLPALLLGVAFADFIRGVVMDSNHDVTGGFFDLLTPFGLLGGVFSLAFFAFHGALFLALRTEGTVRMTARAVARRLTVPVLLVGVVLVAWASALRANPLSVGLAVVLLVVVAVAGRAIRAAREAVAFVASSLAAALIPVWGLVSLWPDVLPARNNSLFSLTIHNASSTPYTLRVMTVVALIFTPAVLIYQGWTYWVFRARVTGADVAGSVIVDRARASAKVTLGAGDQSTR